MPDAAVRRRVAAGARQGGRPRAAAGVHRRRAGVGKTYQMLEDAHELKRQGLDVVIGFVETARPRRHAGADRRSRAGAAAPDRVPRRDAEGDGRRRDHGAPAAGRASSTSSPTPTRRARRTRSATRTCSALLDAGHQRHHRGQHPAHRVAERRDRLDDRRARARDGAGLGAEARRRGRQRRRLGRDAARAAAPGQDLRRRQDRAGARATSSARAT